MTDPLTPVYERMHDQIRRFVASRVADTHQVDDLVQDIFLRVHNNIGNIRDEDKVDAWIFQISRNRIIDYYRKKNRNSVPDRRSSPDRNSAPDLLDLPDNPFDTDDRNELVKRLEPQLREMIDQLPEKYRIVLLLTELEGISHRETARRLGLNLPAVKSRVLRGREKLKELLLECCHFEFDRQGRVMGFEPRKYCPECIMTGMRMDN